jgi:hypothetical protein
MGLDLLAIAHNDGTLNVAGVRLWNALHSDAWRHREAAAQAFLDYVS